MPNAGDNVQAIKKGVMELADLVVINKADIDADAAMRAEAQITSALRLLGMHSRDSVHPELVQGQDASTSSAQTELWHPKVVKISALLGQGVEAFWAAVTEFKSLQTANGQFMLRREKQALAWMWERIEAGLRQSFRAQPRVRELLPQLSQQVRQGQVAASTAARQLLGAWGAPG